MQTITSAKTSLNQVPALFRSKAFTDLCSTKNYDVGGGKYDKATEYLAGRGIRNYVWDPYNRTQEHNESVDILGQEADTSTLANVLNLIDDSHARKASVKKACDFVRSGGKVVVSVYEGDRSGVGCETPKGWQENRKIASYQAEIQGYWFVGDCIKVCNVLVITPKPRKTLTVI